MYMYLSEYKEIQAKNSDRRYFQIITTTILWLDMQTFLHNFVQYEKVENLLRYKLAVKPTYGTFMQFNQTLNPCRFEGDIFKRDVELNPWRLLRNEADGHDRYGMVKSQDYLLCREPYK